MVIDTHQHNWQMGRFPYTWIARDSVLGHDFLPAQGLDVMQPANVTHCVLVEAGAGSQDELRWMLELAAEHVHIAGVVGNIEDMNAVEPVVERLEPELREHLKGVRIVYSPARWIGFDALARLELTCDVLVPPETRPQLAEAIARIPDVTFILDHFAGARIQLGGAAAWSNEMRALAALPNVVMKLSGFLTAADPKPLTAQTLREYVESALDLFGAERLMYGSDWPVCMLGGSYADTVDWLRQATDDLSADEQDYIWHKTAIQTYKLTF